MHLGEKLDDANGQCLVAIQSVQVGLPASEGFPGLMSNVKARHRQSIDQLHEALREKLQERRQIAVELHRRLETSRTEHSELHAAFDELNDCSSQLSQQLQRQGNFQTTHSLNDASITVKRPKWRGQEHSTQENWIECDYVMKLR